MYTLYYSPQACSLATHTILNMLGLEIELIFSGNVENFASVNPAKMVPVLQHEQNTLTEGAAILLYLLDKHENELLPKTGLVRQQAIENMMLANSSMHPAYGRLFFTEQHISNQTVKTQVFNVAAKAINDIWDIVENKIVTGPFLGGQQPSPADILLAVYSRWGQFFPIEISIGPKAQRMIELVLSSDAFQKALTRETNDQQSHEK